MNDSAPLVVLGASGQVGRGLMAALRGRCVGLTRLQCDLAKPDELTRPLERIGPSAVINAAAYTQVDRAETEERLARTVNGDAPGVLARWCAERAIPFVHFSTDYVFPGTGERPWTEEDSTAPVNAYGRSKLAGERLVAAAGGHWLIFRTSWVYDASGRNFVNTMLALAKERETLRVVADQHGAPTYAPQLAEAVVTALERARGMRTFPSGIYHLCNAGATTWHGFAEAIFERARDRGMALSVSGVEAIDTALYPSSAQRPANSRLNTDKARQLLGISMPGWQCGLERCVRSIPCE
jgi:dTDP-4-dehydrorhamnose reductase